MSAESEKSQRQGQAQARFKQRLLELGLLAEIKPPAAAGAVAQDREPIPVTGNPVSDLLIRERR